jgi:hypothetical protein
VGVLDADRQIDQPYTLSITVDVGFEYVQSSIGLVFGPVGGVWGRDPADSTLTIDVPWMPQVSGHTLLFRCTTRSPALAVKRIITPQAGLKQFEQVNNDSALGLFSTRDQNAAAKCREFAGCRQLV